MHDKAVEAGKRHAEEAEKQTTEYKRLLHESIAQLGSQRAGWLEIINDKKVKIAALEAEIAALQSRQPASGGEQGIGARERDSLLKW